MISHKSLLMLSAMLLALALPSCAKKGEKKAKDKTKIERVDSVTYKKGKKDKKIKKDKKCKKDDKKCDKNKKDTKKGLLGMY